MDTCRPRQQNTTAQNSERGDIYTFLGVDAKTKLILSHYSGKGHATSGDCFVADWGKRLAGRVQITTDGFSAYPDTIRRNLFERLDYAVMQKLYEVEDVNITTPATCTQRWAHHRLLRRKSPVPVGPLKDFSPNQQSISTQPKKTCCKKR